MENKNNPWVRHCKTLEWEEPKDYDYFVMYSKERYPGCIQTRNHWAVLTEHEPPAPESAQTTAQQRHLGLSYATSLHHTQ